MTCWFPECPRKGIPVFLVSSPRRWPGHFKQAACWQMWLGTIVCGRHQAFLQRVAGGIWWRAHRNVSTAEGPVDHVVLWTKLLGESP